MSYRNTNNTSVCVCETSRLDKSWSQHAGTFPSSPGVVELANKSYKYVRIVEAFVTSPQTEFQLRVVQILNILPQHLVQEFRYNRLEHHCWDFTANRQGNTCDSINPMLQTRSSYICALNLRLNNRLAGSRRQAGSIRKGCTA